MSNDRLIRAMEENQRKRTRMSDKLPYGYLAAALILLAYLGAEMIAPHVNDTGESWAIGKWLVRLVDTHTLATALVACAVAGACLAIALWRRAGLSQSLNKAMEKDPQVQSTWTRNIPK